MATDGYFGRDTNGRPFYDAREATDADLNGRARRTVGMATDE